MSRYLHQIIQQQVIKNGAHLALEYRSSSLSYQELFSLTRAVANGLHQLGVKSGDRIAIYLPKQLESVVALFAASMAGAVFVPINPLLKPSQVKQILQNCTAGTIITSCSRAEQLNSTLGCCHALRNIITIGGDFKAASGQTDKKQISWQTLLDNGSIKAGLNVVNSELAAILYTSGSTGEPKGVMLSHNNLLMGAQSVAQYLRNRAQDRILALLPLSFDYGLSQITTAFSVGATAILMDYLLPQDVIKIIAKKRVTGLAAVPTLWQQLSLLKWPDEIDHHLRYLTNSGGALPLHTIKALQKALPKSELFLMYGLTEAFRSTYLPPEYIDSHPSSIGKAIPNAEVSVLREDGTPCAPGELGELVHKGCLVSMGYWNNPQATRKCFRPLLSNAIEGASSEIALWSGDTVKKDREGFIYFIERRDEMIKTSGYRVSPTEIETVVHRFGGISHVVAFGAPHSMLGNGIVVVATIHHEAPTEEIEQQLMQHCKQQLANYMVPLRIILMDSLPKNPNGKIDRKRLARTYQDIFQE